MIVLWPVCLRTVPSSRTPLSWTIESRRAPPGLVPTSVGSHARPPQTRGVMASSSESAIIAGKAGCVRKVRSDRMQTALTLVPGGD